MHFFHQIGKNEFYIQFHCSYFLFCKFTKSHFFPLSSLSAGFCFTFITFFFCCRIFFLKQLVAWYFQRKVNRNSEKLSDLRQEKKKLLEQVMEKETYKVALDILNRFGDRSASFKQLSTLDSTPNSKSLITKSTNMTPKSATLGSNQGAGSLLVTPQQRKLQVTNANISVLQQRLNTPMGIAQTPNNNNNRSYSQHFSVSNIADRQHLVPSIQSKRTPYPVIDFNKKTVIDKMVDYLINDGASNRFAMICKECYRHNGEYTPQIH